MAGSDNSLWARLDQAFAFGMPDETGGRWEVVDPSRGRPRARSGSSRPEHRDKVGISVTVIMPPDQQHQHFLQHQLQQRLQQWDLASQTMYSVQAVSSLPSLPSLPLQPLPQATLADPASAPAFGTPSPSQPHRHHQRQLSLPEFQLQRRQYQLQQQQVQQQQAQLEFLQQEQQQLQQQQQQQQEQQPQQRSPQQKPHSSHSHQRSSSSLEGFADRPLPPVPARDAQEKGSPSQLPRPSSSSNLNPASRSKPIARRRSTSCQPTHRRNTSSSSSSIASYVLAASAPSPSLLPPPASPSSPKTKLRLPRNSLQKSQQPVSSPTPIQSPAVLDAVAQPAETVRQRRSNSLIRLPTLAPLELPPLRTTPAPATAPIPVSATAAMSFMSSTAVDTRPYTPLVQSALTTPARDAGKPPSSRHSDAAFSFAPKSSSKSSSKSSRKSRSQSSSSRSDDADAADAASMMSESRRSNSPFHTLKSFSSSSRLRPSAAAPGKAVRKFMRLASMAASSAKDAVSGPILHKSEPGSLYPGGAPPASASASALSIASSPSLTSPSTVATTSASSSRRSSAFPTISTPVPQNLMLRHRSMSKIQQLTGLDMGDDASSAVGPAVSASRLRRSMSTNMNLSVNRAHHASLIQTSSASVSIARSPSTQSMKNDIWNTSMFPSDDEEDNDEDKDDDYLNEHTDGDGDADVETDEREVVVEVKAAEGEGVRNTKHDNSNTMTPVSPDTPDLVTASLLQSLSQTSTKPPPSFQTAYQNQTPYKAASAQHQPYQHSYQSYQSHQSDRSLLAPNRMLKSKRYSDPNMAPIIEHPDDDSDKMDSRRSSSSLYSNEASTSVEAVLIEEMIEKLQHETMDAHGTTSDPVGVPASVPEDTFDADMESSFIPSRAAPVPMMHPMHPVRPSSRHSLRRSDAGTAIPVSAFSSFAASSLSPLHSPSSLSKHIPSIRLFPSAIASAVAGTGTGSGGASPSSSSPSPVSATSPNMPNISNPWPAYPPPRPAPPPPLQLDDISEVDDDEHATADGAEKRYSGSTTSNYRSSVAMSSATSSRLSSSYHARSKSSGSASESIANSVSSVMSSVGSSVGTRATGGGYGYNGYSSFSSFSSNSTNSTNGTGSGRLSYQQPGVPAPPVMSHAAAVVVPAQALPPQMYPPPTSPLPAPPTSASSKAHSPAPSLSRPDETQVRAEAQTPAETPAPPLAQKKQPSPISAFDHDDEDERSLAYRFKKGAVSAVPSRDSVRWRPSAIGKSFFRREASPAPSDQTSTHGHRTSLSATSLKAAGHRMAQATRKTVGGSMSEQREQQREQEKEKWRENLRSQIRVIPEGQSAGSSDASATTPTTSVDLRRASSRGRMI